MPKPREMLEHILEAEEYSIEKYVERIAQADAFGDVGLKVAIENRLADETRNREEIERILASWSPVQLQAVYDG